ncbi:MAG: polysaccharide biosynthesis tyrosine autokinase [Planctomycetia bacterium]|nr:polysaccharide biosynthesis tyrosine autokinase [Planctomycetia bacterium]
MRSHNSLVPLGQGVNNAAAPLALRGQRPALPLAERNASLTPAFVLQALARWWKIALPAGMILGASAAMVAWLTFRPSFSAEAWLRIEDRRPFVAFPTQMQDESKRFVQTQVELIRSPVVVGDCLSRAEIAQLPELKDASDPIEWLSSRLTVKEVGQSELFRIQFRGPNPVNAATIANAVVDAYLKLHSDEAAAETQRIIDVLDSDKAKRALHITRLQENLRKLTKQATGKEMALGSTKENPLAKTPVAVLEERLTAAQVEVQMLEAKYKAAESMLAQRKGIQIPPQAIDKAISIDPEVQRLTAEIVAWKLDLRDYEATSAQPKEVEAVRRLTRRIKDAETALAARKDVVRKTSTQELAQAAVAERQASLESLRHQLESQRMVEKLLQDKLDEQHADLEKSGGQTLDLEFARSELEREEDVFRRIADRTTALRTEQSAPTAVSLLRRAEPPLLPVSTPYALVGGLGGGLFCLPFALAILWELRVRRISSAQQLQEETNMPVIGEITALPVRSALPGRRATERFERDRATFEESISYLRTSLLLCDDIRDLQVVAVASANSREGKTHLAAQLAVNIAKSSGEPTLLIDADLRDPDQHEMFNVAPVPGLAEVLGRTATLDAAIVPILSHRIQLLPAGRLAMSPNVLFGNDAFAELLKELRLQYRYIIIDSPPCLSACEALVVAKAADGTLLCTMRDVSRATPVCDARDRLIAAGARPIGIVLSGVSPKSYAYRYGDYYGAYAVSPSEAPPRHVES